MWYKFIFRILMFLSSFLGVGELWLVETGWWQQVIETKVPPCPLLTNMLNSDQLVKVLPQFKITAHVRRGMPNVVTLACCSYCWVINLLIKYSVFKHRSLCQRPHKHLQWGLQVNLKNLEENVKGLNCDVMGVCTLGSNFPQPGSTWENTNYIRI